MKLKELIVSMLQSFAYDILKKILLIIFTSGFAFTGAYSLLNNIKLPVWCIIIICIAISALVAFVALLINQTISNHYTQSEKVEGDYEILDKVVTFKYDGLKCFYDAEIKLLFKNRASEYYGRFYWSGSGDGRLRPVNRNHRLDILKRRTRYIEYIVVFDKAYRKGKKLTLKLTGVMEDPDKKFSPYFSTTVTDPTRKLTMKLEIDPTQYPIKDLEKEIIPPTFGRHENCEQIQLDHDGVYVWEIPSPKLSYQYSLNWTF